MKHLGEGEFLWKVVRGDLKAELEKLAQLPQFMWTLEAILNYQNQDLLAKEDWGSVLPRLGLVLNMVDK